MIEVIPSFPAPSFRELEKKIELVKKYISFFQIDICDGDFVNAVSWPMHEEDKEKFKKIVSGDEALPFWEEVDFEAHLMINHPEVLLPDLILAGFSRALIHVESKHDFKACLEIAKEKIELGISLKIGTPIEKIDEYVEHISVVQLMGIEHIGSQGQPFDARVLEMIRAVKERYPNVTIEIDGAINKLTALKMVEAGATRLAPGSFVLKSENPKEDIMFLKSLSV
ncbi:hypothetical protein EPO56_01420 [Patescibacteria group bacterium]|nr:MAG: hypothetical protein EPO56_01420 [Patescibacteria group bacterium]